MESESQSSFLCYNLFRGDTVVIVNGCNYNSYEVKTNFRNYSSTKYENGAIKTAEKGVAPDITFDLLNNITVFIETIYSVELLKQAKPNIKIDITKYVTDVLYNEEAYACWHFILEGLKSCHITMLDDKNCNFNMYIMCNNYDDKEIEIRIDSIIKIL
mgnify:CR=1 FL=1